VTIDCIDGSVELRRRQRAPSACAVQAHALLFACCATGADETACWRADARHPGCAEQRGRRVSDADPR